MYMYIYVCIYIFVYMHSSMAPLQRTAVRSKSDLPFFYCLGLIPLLSVSLFPKEKKKREKNRIQTKQLQIVSIPP